MAGNHFKGISPEVSTDTGGAKTHLEIVAAANHGFMMKRVSVAFQGITVTQEAYIVRLVRVTTTGTGTSITLVKTQEGWPDTIQATGKKNFTVEPTLGDVIDEMPVHPQGGWVDVVQFDSPTFIQGGKGLAVVIVSSAISIDCTCTIAAEE